MVEQIEGNAQLLLSPEEGSLYAQQAQAQQSADIKKIDADYQNEPKGDEQCSGCDMFVPGFDGDTGGYCTKVIAIRGPSGLIFPDGWCKFFQRQQAEESE